MHLLEFGFAAALVVNKLLLQSSGTFAAIGKGCTWLCVHSYPRPEIMEDISEPSVDSDSLEFGVPYSMFPPTTC
jgi:hypothetical protein